MDPLDKLNSYRLVVRQSSLELVEKIDHNLSLKILPLEDIENLEELLIEKRAELDRINEEIEDLVDMEDLEGEVLSWIEFKDKLSACRSRIKRKISEEKLRVERKIIKERLSRKRKIIEESLRIKEEISSKEISQISSKERSLAWTMEPDWEEKRLPHTPTESDSKSWESSETSGGKKTSRIEAFNSSRTRRRTGVEKIEKRDAKGSVKIENHQVSRKQSKAVEQNSKPEASTRSPSRQDSRKHKIRISRSSDSSSSQRRNRGCRGVSSTALLHPSQIRSFIDRKPEMKLLKRKTGWSEFSKRWISVPWDRGKKELSWPADAEAT